MKRDHRKAREFEVKAARWLYEANIAAASGQKEKAEKLYARSQFWLDKMNEALGRGATLAQ